MNKNIFIILFLIIGFFATHAQAAYRDVIQSEGTILNYWPMTESSGTTSAALVGGVNINLSGATVGTSGRVDGTAVSFNGTSSTGATVSSLNLTSYSKVVVEAIVYISSYDANNCQTAWLFNTDLVASTDTFMYTVNGGLSCSEASSVVALRGNVNINAATYSRLTTGAWHHIAAIYNKGLSTNEVDLYLDGTLQTAISRPLNPDNVNNFGNRILYLMSKVGASQFSNGKMQHLAIYSDLSGARILAHANLMNTASAITLTGPTTGINTATSTNFSVSSDLPATSTITVTPSDNGGGGTFTPTSVTISSSTPTATFTYTPTTVGSKNISVTNNNGLNNPSPITYIVTSNIPATAVLITAPISGSISTSSTNFIVSTNGFITGNLIITPNDNGGGGTFTPTSVTISSSTATSTFVYTPSSLGVKSISVTNNQSLLNPSPVDYSVITIGSGLVLGDDTVSTYAAETKVSDFIYTTIQSNAGWTATNIASSGHSISQQKTLYLSTSNRSTVDYTLVQIGINDLNPAETSDVAIARLQDLINTINSNKKTGSFTIISTMIPVRQRLIDVYGAINGPIAQQKWIDINEAIKGNGPTPITGVDYRISNHTSLLSDNNGNLAIAYDTGDHIHENNTARQIIGHIWRDSLAELNLLNQATSSVPVINSVTVGNNGFVTVLFNAPQFNGGSPIIGYSVISNPTAVDIDSGSTSTSHTVNGLINGTTYNFIVKAVNSIGWSDNSVVSNDIVAIDQISPSISNIFSVLEKTTSNIRWSTDELSSSYIEYGISPEYMPFSVYDAILKTSHNVNLTDLVANKPYYFRIISRDISNNVSTSSNQTFMISSSHFSPGSSSSGPNSIPLSLRSNTISVSPVFTKSLSSGQNNTEVKTLQQYLNSKGFTISKTGPGSVGKETAFFGSATKAALIKFQKANNIKPSIGFFGPVTREFIKKMK